MKMDKVQIRVDIKNKFSAFEQEGDDDVAGDLLEKFNQMKEEEALKRVKKTAEKKKSRAKNHVPIEVAPKKDGISTQKIESTVEDPTNADSPASKNEVGSVTEVEDTKTLNDDKPLRERVVYNGGKEFTKKTNSKFAAKMLALAGQVESARDSRPPRDREGFRRGREGFTKPADVPATEEASSGQFEEVQKNDRPFRGREGFRRGRDGFREEIREVPFLENAAPATKDSSSRQVEENSRNIRPYRGKGEFRRDRAGFGDQIQQVPSSENAVAEEASSSQFAEKPRSSRPYRGRGGFRGDREGFDKQTVQTEPEEKQYTLDEWKKMQAEVRMKSSLNVAKSKEGVKENKTEEKVKMEDVVEQQNNKTNLQLKFGSASYCDGKGRGRMNGRDFTDERRAPRTVAEVPNVSDESVFPHLK